MYLANYTRPDITFAVNLLARYSSSPTRRHWNRVKQILHYLRGTMNMGLLYSNISKPELNGYADAGYLSDPHNDKSQTGYFFYKWWYNHFMVICKTNHISHFI
uniref:Retrovirus-related Pol polyprotein from transposon TNT 1-94 n=1 Tax=Cajanus cajan TaxID=3821 RepID=A0A151T2R9_CAJCA|nr:Retrovirus-related Pol polyprotein from transposon TNT 1-94 [Cajanus cajan]